MSGRRVAPVWAIVPVKAFAQSKTRLGGVLDEAARAALARATFEHVLAVLAEVPLAGVLVATECPEVAALAARRAEVAFRAADGAPLSVVIDRALADVAARGATAAIVLMADLPWLAPSEVAGLVDAVDAGADVVLVPDERDDGSNGMAVSPPGAFGPTAFGEPRSFEKHRALAEARGSRVAYARAPGLAFDVDGPANLARLTPPARAGGGTARRG